jgi:hypothetical protein
VTDRSARPAVPSRRSFVVGWKAFRCFDDELGIVPSYSADAPALRVLELEDRRRDAHRRCADDDMEAPSVADDCSDLEHGRRHTPNACAGKESAASAARSIPGSEACPPGERVVVPPKRDTVSRARETRLRRAAGRRVYRGRGDLSSCADPCSASAEPTNGGEAVHLQTFSIVFVLRHCPRRSGRGTARADARTCRCRSSVRRSSGSGLHTGPPGRSRAAGHPC